MSYNVFIERAQDPGNVRGVAQAIADRYGMPVDGVAQRIAAGRFRVKAGVDLQTAQRFAADLERLGAVCAIVDAERTESPPARPVAAPTASAAPPPMPAPPVVPRPKQTEILPPVAGPKPPANALAAATPVTVDKTTVPQYVTGLAAAFGDSAVSSSQELGALSEESASFALSSVDGSVHEEPQADPGSFQPVGGLGGPDKDLFAPPDAQPGVNNDLELAIDLHTPPPPEMPSEISGAGVEAPDEAMDEPLSLIDVDPREQSARHAVPSARSAAPLQANRGHEPGATVSGAADNPLVRVAKTIAQRPRVRFAAGVLVALLLGFLPAHVIASAQESSYSTIDDQVRAEQKRVTTVDEWSTLGSYRASALDEKRSRKLNIVVKTGFAWVFVGALFGLLWFRVVPWDRWQ